MAKKNKAAGAPFTAANLIEYLQQFPADANINMTHVTQRGKEVFGYPVEKFTLITDVSEPHILITLGRAVPVERPAQRIKRQQEAAKKKGGKK